MKKEKLSEKYFTYKSLEGLPTNVNKAQTYCYQSAVLSLKYWKNKLLSGFYYRKSIITHEIINRYYL